MARGGLLFPLGKLSTHEKPKSIGFLPSGLLPGQAQPTGESSRHCTESLLQPWSSKPCFFCNIQGLSAGGVTGTPRVQPKLGVKFRSGRGIAGSKGPSPGGAWPPPFSLLGEGGRGTRSDEGSFHEHSRAEGPKGQTSLPLQCAPAKNIFPVDDVTYLVSIE